MSPTPAKTRPSRKPRRSGTVAAARSRRARTPWVIVAVVAAALAALFLIYHSATITTGPADLVAEKMADDKLTVPALVDPDLTVSRSYQANQYGMMGTDRDGHTFVLVGPDGHIQWRADYGGMPNYTMYVTPDQLAADLR